jgi:hypothetical protein
MPAATIALEGTVPLEETAACISEVWRCPSAGTTQIPRLSYRPGCVRRKDAGGLAP